MDELIKLLPRMLLNTGSGDEICQQAACAAWAAASGRQVAQVTAALRLENKTLIVAAIDETWRTQLKRISPQLLFKINGLLGPRCVVGRLEFIVAEAPVRATHSKPPTVEFAAPDQQASYLESNAAEIRSPSLRAAFMRAAGKCLDRRAGRAGSAR